MTLCKIYVLEISTVPTATKEMSVIANTNTKKYIFALQKQLPLANGAAENRHLKPQFNQDHQTMTIGFSSHDVLVHRLLTVPNYLGVLTPN